MAHVFNTRDVTIPKSGLVVYSNSYWLCEDGDPQKALFYGLSPQCNRNERIVNRVLRNNKLYKDKNLEVVFIPIAYVPPIDSFPAPYPFLF